MFVDVKGGSFDAKAEVLAPAQLHCRPAVAEHVIADADARADVVVGVDTGRLRSTSTVAGFRNDVLDTPLPSTGT
jgi:hypothetical protein